MKRWLYSRRVPAATVSLSACGARRISMSEEICLSIWGFTLVRNLTNVASVHAHSQPLAIRMIINVDTLMTSLTSAICVISGTIASISLSNTLTRSMVRKSPKMTKSLIRWTMLAITRHLRDLVQEEEERSKNIKVRLEHHSQVVNACPRSIPSLNSLLVSHRLNRRAGQRRDVRPRRPTRINWGSVKLRALCLAVTLIDKTRFVITKIRVRELGRVKDSTLLKIDFNQLIQGRSCLNLDESDHTRKPCRTKKWWSIIPTPQEKTTPPGWWKVTRMTKVSSAEKASNKKATIATVISTNSNFLLQLKSSSITMSSSRCSQRITLVLICKQMTTTMRLSRSYLISS